MNVDRPGVSSLLEREDVTTVAPGILVEARYATAHNFVGQVIDGYEKPVEGMEAGKPVEEASKRAELGATV